jgi:AraC family transcriptional regulator, arabinose operon regulatory protein
MAKDINILLMGIDTHHHPDFIYERSAGSGVYTVMCFSTPFFIRTELGIEVGGPGDCIVHEPTFPELHGTGEGMSEGFRNDWIHLDGKDVLKLIEEYDIPLNRIIHTGQPHLFTEQFKKIEFEFSYRKPYYEKEIFLLIEDIFLTIGRYHQMALELESYTPSESEYRKRFVEVRSLIHHRFYEGWTVKRMAELVNLSENRFSVLYQKFFKTSPKDDLISKQIETAKILLISSNSSIEEISNSCNFSSFYYFSRIFKKRVGCSPSSFRKKFIGK